MNGETVKVSVLAPKAQHLEIWQIRMASGRGSRQTISAFYVQAAEEKLEKIRKRVRRASR
jgi:hypothetical protein